MSFNYISLDLIIEKLNSMPIPGQEWNISELKEWSWEALSLIGEVKEFVELSVEIEITDNKGVLPKNIHTLHSVLEGSSGYNMDKIEGYDTFKTLTYKTNAGTIFTDFEEGSVILQGYYFPVDEDDKPLIPDNIYFIQAVYSYLRMKLGERLYWQNKIVGQQFEMLKREWYYYCPAAKGDSKMMSEDERHTFKKNNLKPFRNMYRNNRRTVNIHTINKSSR